MHHHVRDDVAGGFGGMRRGFTGVMEKISGRDFLHRGLFPGKELVDFLVRIARQKFAAL